MPAGGGREGGGEHPLTGKRDGFRGVALRWSSKPNPLNDNNERPDATSVSAMREDTTYHGKATSRTASFAVIQEMTLVDGAKSGYS